MAIEDATWAAIENGTNIRVGEVSKPFTEWCDDNGLRKDTVRNRLRAGWEFYKAVTTPVRPSLPKSLTFCGQNRSISGWAKVTGLSENEIIDRIRRGWSVEDVLTLPKNCKRQKNPKVTIEGETKTLAEWIVLAAANGLARKHVLGRLRMGWTHEDALTVPFNCCRSSNRRNRLTNTINQIASNGMESKDLSIKQLYQAVEKDEKLLQQKYNFDHGRQLKLSVCESDGTPGVSGSTGNVHLDKALAEELDYLEEKYEADLCLVIPKPRPVVTEPEPEPEPATPEGSFAEMVACSLGLIQGPTEIYLIGYTEGNEIKLVAVPHVENMTQKWHLEKYAEKAGVPVDGLRCETLPVVNLD